MNESVEQATDNLPVERVSNPFGDAPIVAAPTGGAAAALASREVAEVLGMIQAAKRYPRDPRVSMQNIINGCARKSLAEQSMYQYARGGQDISGPSIRLAEELARGWGNIMTGVKEISRHAGYSECLAYAIDLETTCRDDKLFQVKHWRDKKNGGGYVVTDERDIYELVANMGARRKRACILAVIPGDVVERAKEQCEATLRTLNREITPELLKTTLEKFARHKVTQEMLEKRIQRNFDKVTPALMVSLGKIYLSLEDGMSRPEEWFDFPVSDEKPTGTRAEQIKENLRKKAAGDDDYIAHFDEKSALAAIKKVTTEQALGQLLVEIVNDYQRSKRALPPSIEPAANDKREALQQAAGQMKL
jgi:hypothetical protein